MQNRYFHGMRYQKTDSKFKGKLNPLKKVIRILFVSAPYNFFGFIQLKQTFLKEQALYSFYRLIYISCIQNSFFLPKDLVALSSIGGLECAEFMPWRGVRLHPEKIILAMILNPIWWWGPTSGALERIEYLFRAIAPWFIKTKNVSNKFRWKLFVLDLENMIPYNCKLCVLKIVGFVEFYGISTTVGYLMLNILYI